MGKCFFDHQPIHQLGLKEFNDSFRWRKVSMIFQETSAALNPVLTVGKQFTEVLTKLGKPVDYGAKLLAECGLADPASIYDSYAHELSGGMKQRIMIALALIGDPELLIADEPTTATDATVQAQILALLLKIQQARGMSIIFISHNLKLISQMCHYAYVMYCGRFVESGPPQTLMVQPRHPYTRGLVDSQLSLATVPRAKLKSIPGSVAPIQNWHQGCTFADRCTRALPDCLTKIPELSPVSGEHLAACFNQLPHLAPADDLAAKS